MSIQVTGDRRPGQQGRATELTTVGRIVFDGVGRRGNEVVTPRRDAGLMHTRFVPFVALSPSLLEWPRERHDITFPPCRPRRPSAPAPSPAAADRRPIIIDADFDLSDIAAISVLLRDPEVDVRAIAIDGTGLVHCQGGRLVTRYLLDEFGQPDIPFGCGREAGGPDATPFPDDWRAVADRGYGLDITPKAEAGVPTTRSTSSGRGPTQPERAHDRDLGPLTNLEDAFAADPTLPDRIAGIHAMLGTIDAPGNVFVGDHDASDPFEWNAFADPSAVEAVLATDVPIDLVPLDATDDVPVPADLADRLATDHAAAGADLMDELLLRNPGRLDASQGQQLWDELAALSLSDQDLVTGRTPTTVGDDGRLTRTRPVGRSAMRGRRPTRRRGCAAGGPAARGAPSDAVLAGRDDRRHVGRHDLCGDGTSRTRAVHGRSPARGDTVGAAAGRRPTAAHVDGRHRLPRDVDRRRRAPGVDGPGRRRQRRRRSRHARHDDRKPGDLRAGLRPRYVARPRVHAWRTIRRAAAEPRSGYQAASAQMPGSRSGARPRRSRRRARRPASGGPSRGPRGPRRGAGRRGGSRRPPRDGGRRSAGMPRRRPSPGPSPRPPRPPRPAPAREPSTPRSRRSGPGRRRQGDAPFECGPGRRHVAARLRHEPDDPLRDARQVRVADARRPGARLGRGRAGRIEVAGAQRDEAPLDERARPSASGTGRVPPGRLEVARRRGEVASPPMDAPERDLDAGQVAGPASAAAVSSAAIAAGYSPSRARSSPIRACIAASSTAPRARAASRWSIASRLAKTASARSAASRNAAAASAGRPASRSCAAISAYRPRSSRPARRVRPHRLRGPAMEQPAAGQARRLVRHVAHPAVDEVVRHRTVRRRPGPPGRCRGASTPRARRPSPPRTGRSRPDRREVERATDDRRRRQHLRRRLADRHEPLAEHGLDAPRHATARAARRSRAPRRRGAAAPPTRRRARR